MEDARSYILRRMAETAQAELQEPTGIVTTIEQVKNSIAMQVIKFAFETFEVIPGITFQRGEPKHNVTTHTVYEGGTKKGGIKIHLYEGEIRATAYDAEECEGHETFRCVLNELTAWNRNPKEAKKSGEQILDVEYLLEGVGSRLAKHSFVFAAGYGAAMEHIKKNYDQFRPGSAAAKAAAALRAQENRSDGGKPDEPAH